MQYLDLTIHTVELYLLSGKDYTFSLSEQLPTGAYIQVCFADSAGNWVENTSVSYKKKYTPKKEVHISTIEVVVSTKDALNIEGVTMQLEEGSQATEYEPYIEPKIYNIYLNEPLRKIGDFVDYIDFRTQEVVRNVEVIDDTGTLSLEQSLRGLETPIRQKISIPNIQLYNGKNTIEIDTFIAPSKIETVYYTNN